eukprot:scaffold1746_cov264-Pinguiococcus_pyrenoidosus.AAC.3
MEKGPTLSQPSSSDVQSSFGTLACTLRSQRASVHGSAGLNAPPWHVPMQEWRVDRSLSLAFPVVAGEGLGVTLRKYTKNKAQRTIVNTEESPLPGN